MDQNKIEISSVLAKIVDGIWNKYDTDGNGELDKEETKAFIIGTLSEVIGGPAEIDDAVFNKCFADFD